MAGGVLALTVFSFVLGSSSVAALVGPGRKLRWATLILLAATGVVLAWRERRGSFGRPLLVTLGLGAWLVGLAAVSTLWSADPHLTFGRAGSLGLLFVAAAGLAFATRSRPGLAASLLQGTLWAAAVTAVLGFLLWAIVRGDALEPSPPGIPVRFRGLGENPDTVAMLQGIAAPIALWALLRARTRLGRASSAAALLLFLVSFAASGSRGGLLAWAVGALCVALVVPQWPRSRAAVAAAVVVATAAAAGGSRIAVAQAYVPTVSKVVTQPSGKKVVQQETVPSGAPVPGQGDAYIWPLTDELDRTYIGSRPFFSSSGRVEAWRDAIRQGSRRPIAGFGFGTESLVFQDHIYNFEGGTPENSFVGIYLQLGLVGVVSLLALVLSVVGTALVAAWRSAGSAATPALAGVVAGGAALMLVQSYAYSVGNVATVAFWIAAFVSVARVPLPAARRLTSEQGVVASS